MDLPRVKEQFSAQLISERFRSSSNFGVMVNLRVSMELLFEVVILYNIRIVTLSYEGWEFV